MSTNLKKEAAAVAVAGMKDLVTVSTDAREDTIYEKRAMKADDKSKTLRNFGKTSLAFVPAVLRSNLFGHGESPREKFTEYTDVAV